MCVRHIFLDFEALSNLVVRLVVAASSRCAHVGGSNFPASAVFRRPRELMYGGRGHLIKLCSCYGGPLRTGLPRSCYRMTTEISIVPVIHLIDDDCILRHLFCPNVLNQSGSQVLRSGTYLLWGLSCHEKLLPGAALPNLPFGPEPIFSSEI